jgi:hypothetical protein
VQKRGAGSDAGVRSDLEGTSCVAMESEIELMLVLAVGRWCAAPAIGELPEVERCKADCVCGVHNELNWHSIGVGTGSRWVSRQRWHYFTEPFNHSTLHTLVDDISRRPLVNEL